jgi:hypothetical protein
MAEPKQDHSDSFPEKLNTNKMRREIDPGGDEQAAQHNRDMARVQRQHDKIFREK